MPDHQDVSQWRVLIVDDDTDNLTLAAEYLKYVGAAVRTAFNGEEGLRAVREFTPTIVLCDLSMPIMDGWEFLKSIRKDAAFASTPVIALTAHAMPQDRQRVVEAGFDGYVTKPFMFTALVEEMKRWLTRHHQGDAASVEQESTAVKPTDSNSDKKNPQV